MYRQGVSMVRCAPKWHHFFFLTYFGKNESNPSKQTNKKEEKEEKLGNSARQDKSHFIPSYLMLRNCKNKQLAAKFIYMRVTQLCHSCLGFVDEKRLIKYFLFSIFATPYKWRPG